MRIGFISLLSGNLAGKIVGIMRELLLAALFGTSAPVSALRVATTGTFVPINLVTADALSVGFLPNHSRLLIEDQRRAVVYYRSVERIVLALTIAAAIVLIAVPNLWVGVLAPGLAKGALGLAGEMLIVMSISLPFYVHANLAAYLEMSNGRYLLASARPTVQSIGLMVGTLSAFVLGQPVLLAVGFTAAYVFMSGWALLRVRQGELTLISGPPISREERIEATWVFWRTLRPIIWLPLITQGVWVAERAVTSLVNASAVAALDYARLVTETGAVLISAPLGLLMLSSFATLSAEESRMRLAAITRTLALVGVPLSAILFVGSSVITSTLYARGAFDARSVATTSSMLAGLSVGVWAQTISYAHVKSLNAQRRNRTAALVTASGAIVWIVAQFLLAREIGALGVGLGASFGAVTQLVASSLATRQLKVLILRMALLLPVIAFTVFISICVKGYPWMALLMVILFSVVWLLVVPRLRANLFELVSKGARR
jgi:peptidoglycan biosynthesis protein MviN/MurJ (putative lipid II flippase)